MSSVIVCAYKITKQCKHVVSVCLAGRLAVCPHLSYCMLIDIQEVIVSPNRLTTISPRRADTDRQQPMRSKTHP
jgi:hypothetical protein